MRSRKTEFIEAISRDLTDEDFQVRHSANAQLAAYDFGRANSQEEMDRAFDEWWFRSVAFVQGYGVKEAMKIIRKVRK